MMSSSGSSRIGRFDEAGEGGPLQLGQVLAGEVGDEIGGGIDGPPVDAICMPSNLSSGPCQLACRGRDSMLP